MDLLSLFMERSISFLFWRPLLAGSGLGNYHTNRLYRLYRKGSLLRTRYEDRWEFRVKRSVPDVRYWLKTDINSGIAEKLLRQVNACACPFDTLRYRMREDDMIKKVLIATDGSGHAQKAVTFGADLASKYDAEVVLLHVLLRGELSENLRHMAEVEHLFAEGGRRLREAFSSIPQGRWPLEIMIPSEGISSEGELLHAVGEQILDYAEDLAKERGASKIKKRIEDGNPVTRVLETLEAEDADLLVTGARGLSDLKALMVGSVSHKLSHMAPCTCISVR
jgi:nucleotide-binding universal stress UspA family protein